jgi:hypothetical protein
MNVAAWFYFRVLYFIPLSLQVLFYDSIMLFLRLWLCGLKSGIVIPPEWLFAPDCFGNQPSKTNCPSLPSPE